VKDLTKVKELILKTVDLAQVMVESKVQFVYSPLAADEVQFSCPFHGRDNKPSARLYKSTKTCYCWVCKKRWDVISFTMEREQFGYKAALNYIVDKYKVDTSSIPDDVDLKETVIPKISNTRISMSFIKNRILEQKGKLGLEKYRALVTAYYMIMFGVSQKKDMTENIKKLESKCLSLV